MKINRVPPAAVVPVLVYPDVRVAVGSLTAAFGSKTPAVIAGSAPNRSRT